MAMRFNGNIKDAVISLQYLQLELLSKDYGMMLSSAPDSSVLVQIYRRNLFAPAIQLSVRPWDRFEVVIESNTDDKELINIVYNWVDSYCDEI